MTRPSHLVRLRFLLLAFALAWVMAVPDSVRAEEVPRLAGPITDTTGVLAGRTDDIQAAIQRTLNDHGVQVFVLFVGTTGDLTAGDYASQTAEHNSLGVDDALLQVAMDDRTDYIWVSDGLDAITDDELDAILANTLEPALRDGREADGTIAAIEALGVAADSPPPTEPPIVPGPVEPSTFPSGGDDGQGAAAGGPSILWTIAALVLLALGGWLLYRWWRDRQRRLARPAGAGPAELSGLELRERANAQLIATDERIRDAQQEVDFAEAQYGAEAVADLRTAIGQAQGDLAASFTLRQKLDDSVPEDEATTEAMLREIVERTSRAVATLDAETGQIRRLRDLERDAPTTLVELPGRIEAVEDRLPTARATLDGLARYADSATRPVAGHFEEVEKGLDGARNAVIVGSAAMARDERSDVAVATLEALEGVTGSTELLDAIDHLAATIKDAEARLAGELAEADRDIDQARSLRAEAPPAEATLDAHTDEAASALDAAHRAAEAQPADPVEALRLATEAHRLADAALVAIRDAAAARDRLEAAADSSLRTATAEVDRAATFIASRRRGVGDGARTRLAEAQRHLDAGGTIVTQDPAASIEHSRRAQQLAKEAYQLADTDFSDWDQGGPGWGQPSGRSGDATAEILGQILGGVVGGVIRSGGGGGWGGSPWGTPRRGGGGGMPDLTGGWGRTGGFGTGGFGGGGGGGGGRGRGGRW